MGGESLLSETYDEFRNRVRRELVNKYAKDGLGNVTFVDFVRIHKELEAELKEAGYVNPND